MMLAVIVIALIFISRRKNGIQQAEPTKFTVHLVTGKNMAVEMTKGMVSVPYPVGSTTGEEHIPIGSSTAQCPIGYHRNVRNICILDRPL